VLERDWQGFDEERWHEGSALQADEIQQVYAANRAHDWNSSTMVVQTIHDRLRASRPAPADAPSWLADNGEQVHIGDHVALSWHRDSIGRIIGPTDNPDVPQVVITEGPWVGYVREVYPADMLLKVQRSGAWE
jgi:hypothetical protein